MEGSYIIRIYRKTSGQVAGQRAHDGTGLTGSIESVESGEQGAFHDCEGLWATLVGMTTRDDKPPEDKKD